MKTQRLVVLRHGLRRDEVDPAWASEADRPWDPPLAPQAVLKVQDVVQQLAEFGVEAVISSPYLRCLQTTAIVVQGLLPNLHAIEVDLSLGEVASVAHCANQLPREGETFSSWMWRGASTESSCQKGLQSVREFGANVGELSVSLAGKFPEKVPENLVEARSRYNCALEAAADRMGGKTTLVISHGEAVGAAVQRIQPQSVVYEAKHCCFSVAERSLDEDGDWGFWQLAPQESHKAWGVQWE